MMTIAALLFLLTMLVSLMLRARPTPSRVLIIGATPLARHLAAEIALRQYWLHSVVGVVDDATEVEPAI